MVNMRLSQFYKHVLQALNLLGVHIYIKKKVYQLNIKKKKTLSLCCNQLLLGCKGLQIIAFCLY